MNDKKGISILVFEIILVIMVILFVSVHHYYKSNDSLSSGNDISLKYIEQTCLQEASITVLEEESENLCFDPENASVIHFTLQNGKVAFAGLKVTAITSIIEHFDIKTLIEKNEDRQFSIAIDDYEHLDSIVIVPLMEINGRQEFYSCKAAEIRIPVNALTSCEIKTDMDNTPAANTEIINTSESIIRKSSGSSGGSSRGSSGSSSSSSSPAETDANTLVVSQCNDLIDNDGDGLVDWQYDQGCYGPNDTTEGGVIFGLDNGWTVFELDADAQIIYVSSSEGDDNNDGLTAETSVKTLAQGKSLMRSGYSDWLLLKRGDHWTENLGNFHLRGTKNHPILVSSYGSSFVRPLLKHPGDGIALRFYEPSSNIAIVGLDFYASRRDDTSSDFVSYDDVNGISISGIALENIYFEDIRSRFYDNFVIQAARLDPFVYIKNVTIRRSIISNHFSVFSHSQGFYGRGIDGLVFEENILDHNGWRIQGDGRSTKENGGGTKFNHNMYISKISNAVVRNNIVLRPSSINIKTRSDAAGDFTNAEFSNNFLFDGDVGFSIGGNTDEVSRFNTINVSGNVLTNLGRTSAVNASLAWYLGIIDNIYTQIDHNYFLNQKEHTNTYALYLGGESNQGVHFTSNVIDNLYTSRGLIFIESENSWSDIVISDNYMSTINDSRHVEHFGNFTDVSYSGNIYDSDPRIRVNKEYIDPWTEPSYSVSTKSYNPISLDTYSSTIGGEEDVDSFIEELMKQSKYNWRSNYTTQAINEYFKNHYS